MERYNKWNLFNQTFTKIANQIVTNLLPRVARPATGSGRLEIQVFWEFYQVKIDQVAHKSCKFVIIDTPPSSIYVIYKPCISRNTVLW